MLSNINIDKDLVPIKAHYFLYNAGTGPLVIFLPLIAKQLGFSGILVGSIYFILPITGLVAKPLFGGLADRFKLHKVFFILFQAILALAFFSLYFIPEIQVTLNANTTLTCNNAELFIKVCPSKGLSKSIHDSINKADNIYGQLNLSCNVSSKIYNELCIGWKENKYCPYANETNESIPGPPFNFAGLFNMAKDLEVAKCLEIKLQNISFVDNNNNWKTPMCNTYITTYCNATWTNVTVMKEILLQANTTQNNDNGDEMNYQFHLFLWAAIISWIGMAVVVVIADAICFDILGENRRKDYGKQKLWGSIAFGIFSIGTGFLIDGLSTDSDKKDYSCIFYGILIAIIMDMIVSAMLNKKSSDPTVENDPSVLWEFGAIVREGRVLVFAFWCIGAGMCTGVIWNFLLWHTTDLMNNDITWLTTLLGLMTGVQCFLGELPFNFLSDIIIQKLGHMNVTSLVLLIFSIRFMAYSLIHNAWLYLFIELLHGPTVGLTWPAMVMYGDKIAPSGIRATMQGFIGAVFEGVGVAAGSLISGWLMDKYGGVTVFRVFSVGALVWLGIYWILQLLLRKVKAYPLQQGHSHLASYAAPTDAILMTMSQELQTY